MDAIQKNKTVTLRRIVMMIKKVVVTRTKIMKMEVNLIQETLTTLSPQKRKI